MASLKKHSKDPGVVGSIFKAINNLTCLSKKNKQLFNDQGTILKICDTMRFHGSSPEVIKRGFGALRNLTSQSKENINLFIFIFFLDKTLEANVRYRLVVELAPKLRRWPENIVLISNALWTFVHIMSTYVDTKTQAVGMGVITSIHECLDQFP